MEQKEKLKRIAEIMVELEELGVNAKLDKNQSEMKVVGEGINKQIQSSDGMVVEIADSGRGFQVFADYSRDKSGKLKRLVRE